MENVEMKMEKNVLVIRIDMTQTGGISASGKTIRVASTLGNVDVTGCPGLKIGINAYRKPEAQAAKA